jgi:hypothetical protein
LIVWDLACGSLCIMQQIVRGELDKYLQWVSTFFLIYCHNDYNPGGDCGDGVIIWELSPPPTSCCRI